MKEKKQKKMAFFAQRDWGILHFLLTFIVTVVVILNCLFLAMFYDNYLNNFDSQGDVEYYQQQQIEDLKRRIQVLEQK